MCARFFLFADKSDLMEEFDLSEVSDEIHPRYNIPPASDILAVLDVDNKRQLRFLKWGFIPFWAKDESIGQKLINAKAETILEKPSFRSAFKSSRCIIPVNGFYEWKQEGKYKQPYAIKSREDKLLGLAGIWEQWDKQERPLETCAIITTSPNKLIEPLHNRMPVIISKADYSIWLDSATPIEAVQHLLKPYPDELLTAYPVDRKVGNPRNSDVSCILPIFSQ